MTRLISSSRPITGSIKPAFAALFRLRPNWSRKLVWFPPSLFGTTLLPRLVVRGVVQPRFIFE